MDGACSIHGKDEESIHSRDQKSQRRKTPLKTYKLENNIQMDLNEIE
jgi:hypothetical protein